MEEEVLFKIEIDGIRELEKLKVAITQNKEEQKLLQKEYREGKLSVEAFAKESIKLENELKKNQDTFKRTQQSVTGVKTKFDELIDTNKNLVKTNQSIADSLLKSVPGLDKFKNGFVGLNATMKANPVGLVITAFVALKGIFESNAKVADELSFAFAGLTKGFGSIIDTIVTTVTSFDKLGEAIMNPIGFIKDLVGGTIDAAKAGYEAAEAIDAFTVAQAKANQEIQIADIRIQALEKTLKDKTKSEQERIKIANQIADMEIENLKRKEASAKQELANEELRLKNKTLSGEEEAKIIDLQTQVFIQAEEAKTAAALRQTRINILLAKEEASEKAAITDADIKRIEKSKGFEVEVLKSTKLAELQITKDINAEIAIANKQLEDKNVEFKIESAKTQQQIQRDNLAKTGMAINQTADLFKKGSAQQRTLASAGAIVNTYQAATAALAPPPLGAGPIFGPIFAGIAIATGLANVAKINAVGFARGGLTGTRISSGMGLPVTRSNGDNMLATVKTGEVILNERHQSMLGGPRTFAAIGVPGFANSGLTSMTRGAAIASEGSIRNNQLLRSISQMKIVTTVEDINLGQARVAEIVDRAQVL